MQRRAVGAAAALAMTLTAAGCGGDDGPSREEFTSDVNQICQRHTAAIEAEASQVLGGGELPSPREFGRLAQQTIIPEVTAMFEELREVEPPDDLEDDYTQFLDRGDEAVQQMREDPTVIQNPQSFQELNSQVEELGLSDACRVGPS